MTFLYDIHAKYPEGQFTTEILEAEGKGIL